MSQKGREQVSLYGSSAAHFREVKREMAEQMGHEPSNARVVERLMELYERTGADLQRFTADHSGPQ